MHDFKTKLMVSLFLLVLFGSGLATADCDSSLNFKAKKLHSSEELDFCDFNEKVILVVNTASRCGFSPQFEGLEALHQKYNGEGLVIVGFPSNDFKQEYDDAQKTAEICYINYGVTFPMLAQSSVKGQQSNDFFKWLIDETGVSPKWNFNKYLIGSNGEVLKHFGSFSKPLGGRLEKAVVAALAADRK